MKKYFVNRSNIIVLDESNLEGLRSHASAAQFNGLVEIVIKGAVAPIFTIEPYDPEMKPTPKSVPAA